jgi:hypothetical protein
LSQQNPKKPGSRDISELKARLGLKKGAAAAPAAGQPAAQGRGGGVVPPPGLNLPPPPGVKPAGPQIPNAADDPFGAMNAMAQVAAVQRAPEIVIVNDGKPVESVSAGTRAATIGKYAALAIVPLILGLVIGQIASDAKAFNAGLSGAKAVHKDVQTVKSKLGELKNAFESAGAIKNRKVAEEVSAALTANREIAKNKEIVFRVKQGNFDAALSSKVMLFYAMVSNIEELIADHEGSAKQEENAIKAGAARSAGVEPKEGDVLNGLLKYRYGIVLTNPSEEDAGKGDPQAARIVEIGNPLCSGKASSNGQCPNGDTSGFLYRFDTSPTWIPGEVAAEISPGEAYPLKKIIPLAPNPQLDALVKGAEATVSEIAYFKRLSKIYEAIGTAYEFGEAIANSLNQKARAPEKFTWFL